MKTIILLSGVILIDFKIFTNLQFMLILDLKDVLSIPKSGVEEWVTCQAFQCETNLKLTSITMMVGDFA